MDIIIPQSDASYKYCSKCHKEIPRTNGNFSRNKAQKDGWSNWCKSCVSEYQKRYKKENKEKINEKGRQYSASYYAANKERLSEKSKQRYASNRERILARQKQSRRKRDRREYERERYQKRKQSVAYIAWYKQYRELHREEMIVSWREYRQKNAYQLKVKQRARNKTEKGRMIRRAADSRRRARRNAIEGKYTPQQIQEQLKRQHYHCYYACCGYAKFENVKGKYIFHIEHTVPLSRTEEHPRNDIDSIVLSCPSCNKKKGSKLPHEFFEGERLL